MRSILFVFFALATSTYAQNNTFSYGDNYVSIERTLAIYPLAVDSKDFGLLSEVFAPNVQYNFSTALGVVDGLPEVETMLQQSLELVDSQHAYTTQRIDIHIDLVSANSTTYFTALYIGHGQHAGQRSQSFGMYLDDLISINQGGHDPDWRVQSRTVVFIGSSTGTLPLPTILGLT